MTSDGFTMDSDDPDEIHHGPEAREPGWAVRSYFGIGGWDREQLKWAVATRVQLSRWEPLVAWWAAHGYGIVDPPPGRVIWRAEREHHFLLVSAAHLVTALRSSGRSPVRVDDTLRRALESGRDLHEHWIDNRPVFNTHPSDISGLRYESGRRFAQQHPDRSPYDWLRWSPYEGAIVTPDAPAAALHELSASTISALVRRRPELANYTEQPGPTGWVQHERRQWAPDVSIVAQLTASEL